MCLYSSLLGSPQLAEVVNFARRNREVACSNPIFVAYPCPTQKPGLFLKTKLFFVLVIGRVSAGLGGWGPCSLWKLHPAADSPSLKPFKHAWRNIGPSLTNTLFFGFDDWRGFCLAWWVESLWLEHPAVGYPSQTLLLALLLLVLDLPRMFVSKVFYLVPRQMSSVYFAQTHEANKDGSGPHACKQTSEIVSNPSQIFP